MKRDNPDILERCLPYDMDAEMALLGSIFINPDCCDELRGIVVEEDFFDEAHRVIYHELQAMRDAGLGIDLVLFVDRAKTAGVYECIGGGAALYKITQSVPNAAHANYYAKVVADKAKLRGVITAATEILREAYDSRTPAIEVLSRAESRLFALRDSRSVRQARPIGEVCHETLDRIDLAMKGEGTIAIPTGFDELDRNLGGGLREAELIVVAARPSMGKSALTADFCTSIARKHLAAFFSLEMTAENLCERMLSAVGGIDGMHIRNRTLSGSDMAKLTDTAIQLTGLQMHVDDNSQIRVGDIAASVRMIEQRVGKKVELIVVDYLQFISPDEAKMPREQQVATTAKRLKQLAKDRRCPVVAVSSMNRKNEDGNDKRPKLSQLRESGGIEFDADVVLLLHREDYYLRGEEAKEKEGLAEVIIAKQRNGPCATVELRWDAKHTRFQNLAPERLQEFDDYNEQTGTDFGDYDGRRFR